MSSRKGTRLKPRIPSPRWFLTPPDTKILSFCQKAHIRVEALAQKDAEVIGVDSFRSSPSLPPPLLGMSLSTVVPANFGARRRSDNMTAHLKTTSCDGSTMNACWVPSRSSGCGRPEQEGSRSARRRRRALCTVAVVAAYAAASLPCGSGFVAPGLPSARLTSSHVSAGGLEVVGQEVGARRAAAKRRRSAVDAVRMVRAARVPPGRTVRLAHL